MSSPTKPGSINARGAHEEVPRAVNNLINNQPGKRPSASSTRETSPLVTVSGGDSNGLERDGRRRWLSRVMQLLGVALLVAAGVFGFLALRRTHTDSVPFPTVSHPFKPSASWGLARRPYPTGAWWLNLMMEEGEQNVGVLPYAVKATKERGIEVSYSRWRHLSTETVEADLFSPDLVLRSVEEASERTLEGYDPLSVTLQFKTSGKATDGSTPFYRAPLVRGSPYLTIEYSGCTPNISSEFPITTINGLLMHDNNPLVLPSLSGHVFECTIISGQVWLLFASRPITFTWTPKGLVADKPYNGFLRAAYVADPSMKPMLVQHWQAYPSGGRVLLDYNSDSGDDMITVQWRKKGLGDEKLLMLALPHHVEVLQNAQTLTFEKSYVCMKGAMTLVVGDRWFLKEKVPAIRWTAPRKIQDPAKLSAILAALPKDVYRRVKGDKSVSGEDLNDPYWAGKDMARLARLALIADELGDHEQAQRAVQLAELELEPWLEGSNKNPLVYDDVWGGLIVKDGLKDPYSNFGNGHYNDHHFQYGYFIYTAAAIAKLDPAWASKYRGKLDALVADVVNYRDDSPHFPMARHKDFYDGHSWASGLFVQNNGKSQESSSEAINCYYGATLYGEAVGDHSLKRFAGLLLAMEIRSTRWYWHMRTNDTVYDSVFAANKMVGVVGATDATCHTWFGTKFEFVHGINFMPFTPITEAYLDKGYVSEEYPLLSSVLTRAVGGEDGPVEETWKGFIYLDHAVLDPNAAWNEVLSLRAFDSGNSLTNSLYWIATRPDAGPSPLIPSPSPALPPLAPGPEIVPSSTPTNSSSTSSSSAAGAGVGPTLKLKSNLKLDGGRRRARRRL